MVMVFSAVPQLLVSHAGCYDMAGKSFNPLFSI